jgi:CheY-like chemotaxis protein/HPt (histidine-containing phosphotransfer) domain-containing protein
MSTLLDALSEAAMPAAVVAVVPQVGDALSALLARPVRSRILLVEDNPINREVAVARVVSAGVEVDVAVNGVEAVAMAQVGEYELILMDVQMPEMDGLQAARTLRDPRARRVGPIIAMTANAFDEDREACLQAGMDDHLAKPVDPEALYQALLRWLPAAVAAPGAATLPAPPRPADAATKESSWPRQRSRLEAIPGLDAPFGLQLFGGNAGLYERVLALFAATYAAGVPPLQQADAGTPTATLAEIGHSVRGASGSIGARRVEAAAALVESLAKTGASPSELAAAAQVLQDQLVETARRIAEALSTGNSSPRSL